MLVCHACMRRSLQAFVGKSAVLSSYPHSKSPIRSRIPINQRDRLSQRPFSSFHSRGSSAVPQELLRGTEDPSANRRQQWLESRGIRPAHKPVKGTADTDYVVRKHLTYLKDPLKLADFVLRALRNDEFENTIMVVRAASKNIQCIVSWNHLIDWQLSKGRMNAAIKLYNEMKKRAQVPDAHTYTILFRGCAEHRESNQALEKVMSIYHSMLADKSPIKPNTIHMNAVLKMCAQARDMNALFSVVATLPPKGVRSPNTVTYTTIINAIKMNVFVDMRGSLTPMQQRSNCQKAILEARRIWGDVTKRWHQGDLWIDEELVCAMGRMLLLGERHDYDDVLSLIEMSMNIPRQIPPIGTPARAMIDPGSQGQEKSYQNKLKEVTLVDCDSSPTSKAVVLSGQSIILDQIKGPSTSVSAYAKPGRNALSLVLQTLLELRLKHPATKYWDMFTKDFGVIPDQDNFHAYLRILRVARASTETVELLQKMPRNSMVHKTFRIAMSTCQRDKENQHAFSNSGKILDIMQMTLEVPDIPALLTYLSTAVSAKASNNKSSSNAPESPSKLARGKQILRALDRLNPSLINVKSLLAYGNSSGSRPESRREKDELTAAVLELNQKMISAFDLLMNHDLVPREMYQNLTAQRSKLAAFVTKRRHARSKSAPSAEEEFEPENLYKILSRTKYPELQSVLRQAENLDSEKRLGFYQSVSDKVGEYITASEDEREKDHLQRYAEHIRTKMEEASRGKKHEGDNASSPNAGTS